MEKLIEKLKDFKEKVNRVANETVLQSFFEELAPAFLYSGYINVRNEYRVYIRTIEFYFHSEEPNGIHDPIVYHRNGKELEEVPYFPFMSLHAHSSGFDITFENETEKYRASALIRSYEVIDMQDGKYLKWDTKKSMFVKSDMYCYNIQSTYLYALLNGFSLGNANDIRWVDEPIEQTKTIIQKPRQNVFQSMSEWEYKKIKEKRCKREWSFTREERV